MLKHYDGFDLHIIETSPDYIYGTVYITSKIISPFINEFVAMMKNEYNIDEIDSYNLLFTVFYYNYNTGMSNYRFKFEKISIDNWKLTMDSASDRVRECSRYRLNMFFTNNNILIHNAIDVISGIYKVANSIDNLLSRIQSEIVYDLMYILEYQVSIN